MGVNWNAFTLDLYDAAAGEPLDRFVTGALTRLQSVIGFQSAGLAAFRRNDDGTVVLTSRRGLDVHPDKPSLRQELIGTETFHPQRGVASRDPLLTAASARPGRARTIHWRAIGDAGVREYARSTGALNSLSMVLLGPDRTITVFSLWRAGETDTYSRQHVARAELLMPHVLQAIRISRRLAISALIGSAPADGVLIVERNGTIHHIDDVALLLLRREFLGWVSSSLPAPLHSTLLDERAARHAGREIIVTARWQGNLVFLAIKAHAHGAKLTRAELRVVDAVLRHGTYKEAARRLGVSPSTVRNQLHATYTKLGIAGKSDLVKRFGAAD